MKDMLRKLVTRVPREYRDEFFEEIYRHNLFRTIIAALVFIIAEMCIILFLRHDTYDTIDLIYIAIAASCVYFPVMCVIYRKKTASRTLRKTVSIIYACGLLVFFCAIAIVGQDRFGSINTYVMGLFGFAAIMYVRPVESFIIQLFLYIGFFFALPVFQHDALILDILRTNAFIMNVFAFILSRLVFRMKVLSFVDRKVIEQKNQILKEMITRDPMTSLLNHDNAFRALQDEINRAKRIGYPVSVIMADIDDFKAVNDRFGYQIGDQVIVGVAGIIVGTCRRTDIVCRYGGDEYMLILPDTFMKEAMLLADRIIKRVEGTELINGIHVTLSAGVSEFDGEPPKELIFKADRQLHRAKHSGKNRACFPG